MRRLAAPGEESSVGKADPASRARSKTEREAQQPGHRSHSGAALPTPDWSPFAQSLSEQPVQSGHFYDVM
jgi:hypothetical protein